MNTFEYRADDERNVVAYLVLVFAAEPKGEVHLLKWRVCSTCLEQKECI